MADFNKTVDLDKGLNQILDKIDSRAEELRRRGEDAGEAFGDGWDDGLDNTVEKIKASSVKMDKAFKNLSEKVRKQVQQLSINIGGKDAKIKIDFSDIDINSDDIKKQIERKVERIKASDLIDFDTKGFDGQLTNFVTLFMKYREKLNSLQQVYPSISTPKDAQNNLQQQLVLATELNKMYQLLNGQPELFTGINIGEIRKDLSKLQQFSGADTSKTVGEYDELSRVLKEIQGSLKIISDTFKNENNSMKAMAKDGTKSFESLSQVIIEVYNNLTKVQGLVDTISKKDFNVTNITSTAPTSAPTSKRQTVKDLKAEVEAEMQHVKKLYEEMNTLIKDLQSKRMSSGVMEAFGLMSDFDDGPGLHMSGVSYDSFEQTIIGQMADAKTKSKIENLLVVIDGYITKLTEVNKLREKYGLGEWQDPFVKTPQPTVQPVIQPKPQDTATPIVTQSQEVVTMGDAEAQQMTSLKGAVDEVSKAIGRKNAGFIKEKEIVDASVEAEKAKLRELVGVITNEIGNALDGIKTKFAQSFAVPELDKNNLQASFDEIYNKFIELKDKISTMKIDIGINTANITMAIQEALYAKEIAVNYKKVAFEDIFESDWTNSTWTNRFTGEIFDTFESVDDEFDSVFDGLFKSKDGYFLGTKEEMLADFLSKQSADNTLEQENWAQVIVEAINTQGGNIVEAIKLILPKNTSENSDIINEQELSNAFRVLVEAIESFSRQTNNKPDAFFRAIRSNDPRVNSIRTPEVDNALRTLGLLSNTGEITFTIPDTGMRNLGVAIADRVVATSQEKMNVDNAPELMKKLDEAAALGASVPRIISLIEKSGIPTGWGGKGDAIFQLQERAHGINIASSKANNDFSGITDEQIDRLIHTFEVLSKVGLYPDFIGDNILFDKEKGFSLIDLDTENIHGRPMDTPQDMIGAFLKNIFREPSISQADYQMIQSRLHQRMKLPPEQRLVNADTIAAERMVASQAKAESKPSEVKITPTIDDGAVAKVVEENVAKTPATVKVTPIVDDKAVLETSQNTMHPVQQMIDALRTGLGDTSMPIEDRVAEVFKQNPILDAFNKQSGAFEIDKWWDMLRDDFDASQLIHDFDEFAKQNQQIINTVSNTQQSVDNESQSAIDAAKSFIDAANAKKQFVEANKQVAKSAEESASAVEAEAKAAGEAKQTMAAVADDTVQPSNWDRIAQLQADHGEDPFALRRSKTENAGDKSVRTIVESWTAIKDEDGNLTGEMELNTVQIINDFKKRTDAIAKESEKIKTAQAYLQKFLTQFNNKTMGKGSLLSGYQDLEALANSHNFKIDDIAKAEQMMSNLDAEYNKVVQSMRKGSSSMNPFVNAINGMDKMEDVLRGIYLQFQTLDQQPEWLKNQIIDLYKQLDDVSAEADIYKFAEGFGNLKVSINSVVESIRQQRTEQKLALSDFNALIKATKARDTNTEKAAKEEDSSAWKTYYLDRAAEQQKIIDAIRIGLTLTEAQEAQLNAMAEKHALILGDITRENNKIEEQKQKYEEIMRLLEKNHADQIELDNDTSLDASDRSAYQQILNEERAEIEALIAGADLNPEQTRSVNQFTKSIESDRISKVKEYIDLLKLQQDYEKKAAKEEDDSKMQSFYNEQIAKVKEKIKTIDIDNIANQEEKNRLLAIEEAHQREITEIKAKQDSNQDKEKDKAMLVPQQKKIQEKFDAGYLSKDQYDNWRVELAEYQNYMTGVTQADEATIQNKKQHLLQLYDAMTKMSNASKSFFASGGEILPKEMWLDKSQIDDMSTSLMNLYNNISGERFEGMTTAITRVRPELGKLFFTVDDGNGSLSQYVIHVNQATGATKLLADSTKPTLTVLQRFGQTLKKDFTGLLTAVMGGTSIHTFVQYMRQGIQSVRELDLALTELKKVTDETEETYDRFLDTAAKTGARIGSTLRDVTSATAEFAKLGYDIEQAASMAESALVYTNVGDNVDVETGSQSIISTMKAFGIEADNTMSIVDKFNEVGNNFAITTKGIGDALQVSASAMAAAGNTLDETIALTTAANTIVQNPNTVGTALKTLSLRIRGVKTE